MTSPVIKTVTVRIEGRVQGVYFRAWTSRLRLRSGSMAGCAMRSDGSVEAVFSGPDGQVAEMLRRCAEGPAGCQGDDRDRYRRRWRGRSPVSKVIATHRWLCWPKTRPKLRSERRSTLAMFVSTPSAARLVTRTSVQAARHDAGEMFKVGVDIQAHAVQLTQRRTRTPIEAIFAPST